MKRIFTTSWILALWLFLSVTDVQAFHIVGGEITYKCLGNDNYRVALTVYRDCNCVQCGDLDSLAHIFVFRQGTIDSLYRIVRPPKDPVAPPINLCIEDENVLNDVCVEKADYEIDMFLPPNPEGYDLVYQRYSRNETLININVPSQTGSSYLTHIPSDSLATCNSSPAFKEFPPTMLCTNVPFSLDQSAMDSDGDSLVYKFCNPWVGGADSCPVPGDTLYPLQCHTIPPPPYNTVSWANGYDAQNPLGMNVMTLNPMTGLLSGTPPFSGQYVVGICVEEYRNGILLNSIRRDFQFNVIECDASVAQVVSDEVNAFGEYVFNGCNDFTVEFFNSSIKANKFLWDFGVPGISSDVSTEQNPSYQYPDTGKYVGQLIAIYETPDVFCVDTAEIVVLLYPTVDANFENDIACYYESTNFTNTSLTTHGKFQTFLWDFGDGNTSMAVNPTHKYAEGGTYTTTLTATTNLGCKVSYSKEVYVEPKVADFSTTLKCPGVPIDFQNETGVPTVSWQWNFGEPSSGTNNQSNQENPSHIYGSIGDYSVSLYTVSAEGCRDTALLDFTIYPEFISNAGADFEICLEEATSLLVTTNEPTTPYTFEWSPAASLNSTTVANPILTTDYEGTRNYTVTVRDPNGCLHSDELVITGLPLPEVSAPLDSTICFGDEIQLQGAVGSTTVDFEWQNGSGTIISDTIVSPIIMPQITDSYSLIAIDGKGCTDTATVDIAVIPLILNFEVSADSSICFGESLELSAFSEGSDGYVWKENNTLSELNNSNTIATPFDTTTYYISAFNGCFTLKDSIKVSVIPTPIVNAGEDITINIGESETLNATSIWDLEWAVSEDLVGNTSLSPTVSPLETTTFHVTTTDIYGCQSMDSVRVTVETNFEVTTPTAFSPNRDGFNDGFGIEGTKGLEEILEFKIFTRWGREVFSTSDINEQWNGEYDFRPMSVGTYVYYVKARTLLGTEMVWQGNLTLIR